MSSVKASNSILAKARAKYGRRLTPKNYRDMAALPSVSDVAAYLKNYTRFSEILANTKESSIHRDYLEKLIVDSNLENIAQLCRFEKSAGEKLYEYIVQKVETDEIINFVRYLAAGIPEQYLLDFSGRVDKMSKINFFKLAEVRSFKELMAFMAKTRYRKVFHSFPSTVGGVPDVTMIEASLDNLVFKDTLKLIKSGGFSEGTKKELEELLGVQADLLNLRRLYRGKKYYNVSTDLLRARMIDTHRHFSKRTTEKLIAAADEKEVLEIIKTTYYNRFLDKYDFEHIDFFAACVMQELCGRRMKMSVSPAVVMFCYVIYTESETENITNIIEGVRYEESPDKISQVLIQIDKEGG